VTRNTLKKYESPIIVTPGGQTANFRQQKSQNIRIVPFWTFQKYKKNI